MHPELKRLQQKVQFTLLPGNPEFDERRTIFNGMIDRRPDIIVQPTTDAEVREAILAAAAADAPLAIRGGGHNVAGNAICEGGLVIDFHRLQNVFIDRRRRTANVGPGASWGVVDTATARHGLATPGGIISDTGVAGLTLGGGLGWLMGVHGLTCDNLRSARVVLADGTIMTASQYENADLFWGLRGGGGNFGVVVDFEFELHPVRDVYAGALTYPLTKAGLALRRLVDVGESAPDELTMSAILTTSPTGQKTVELDACYLGSLERGQEATAGLVLGGPALSDTRRPQPYVDWQRAFDDPFRRGRRSYWKGLYVTRLDHELFELLEQAMETVPSPHTMLTFDHQHGAANRVPAGATAFSHRDKSWLLLINTNWDSTSDDDLNIEWTRSLFAQLEDFGPPSGYVNYLSDEGASRVRAAYGVETFDRLTKLKSKYDPENLFHFNQNIPPLHH